MMNKILKNKRIIAFLLVFTLSFGVISDYKQKETQAIALIDDLLFWTVGGLLLLGGLVIVNNPVNSNFKESLGRDFISKWRIQGNSMNDLLIKGVGGIIKGIKITNKLKEFLKSFNKSETITSNSITDIGEHDSSKNELIFNSSNYNKITGYPYPILFMATLPMEAKIFRFRSSTTNPWTTANVSSLPDGKLYYSKGQYSTSTILYDTLGNEIVNESGGFKKIAQIEVLDANGNLLPYNLGLISDYATSMVEGVINQNYIDSIPIDDDADIITVLPIPTNRQDIKDYSHDMPITNDNVKDLVTSIPRDRYDEESGVITGDIPNTWVNEGNPPIEGDSGILNGVKSFFTGLWDLLKSLLNSILSGINGILDFLKNIVLNLINAFMDLLSLLFVPTVAISELFSIPSNTGFGAVLDLFNWNSIWNIEPKPYKFKTDMLLKDLSNNNNDRNWNVEINIFDNPVVKDNLNLFRNVLSYSLLISVVYFIVYHFLPKRDMD